MAIRSEEIASIIKQQIQQFGAEVATVNVGSVIEAGDGADAISRTTERGPDVVLMDLSLPGIDGWEATTRLKNDERTAHIPVVALTAHDGAGELERATRAGCDWFVPKPCPPAALIVEIRRVLSGLQR